MAIPSPLAPFLPLVDFLGQVLGKHCEVLLYDLTSRPPCVLAIANGHISGRSVGSVILDISLEAILSPKYQDKNAIVNYPYATMDGARTLRSSAYRIKNDDGETVGVFCINYDITDWIAVHNLLSKCISISTVSLAPQQTEAQDTAAPLFQEYFSPSVEETLHHSVDQLLGEYSVSPDRLRKSEKQQIVLQMYNRGLFTFKGSVALLAKKMDVSEQTVYRYLRECSKK